MVFVSSPCIAVDILIELVSIIKLNRHASASRRFHFSSLVFSFEDFGKTQKARRKGSRVVISHKFSRLCLTGFEICEWLWTVLYDDRMEGVLNGYEKLIEKKLKTRFCLDSWMKL